MDAAERLPKEVSVHILLTNIIYIIIEHSKSIVYFNFQVIVQILSYLTLKDRKNVALVNKAWYHGTVDPIFTKSEIFNFNFSHLNNTLKSEQLWPWSCCRRIDADSVRIRSIKDNKIKEFL